MSTDSTVWLCYKSLRLANSPLDRCLEWDKAEKKAVAKKGHQTCGWYRVTKVDKP